MIGLGSAVKCKSSIRSVAKAALDVIATSAVVASNFFICFPFMDYSVPVGTIISSRSLDPILGVRDNVR